MAIVGDVSADWLYSETRPSEAPFSMIDGLPRWRRYATHSLYSIPGGAWFLGALVRGWSNKESYSTLARLTLGRPTAGIRTQEIEFQLKGELLLELTGGGGTIEDGRGSPAALMPDTTIRLSSRSGGPALRVRLSLSIGLAGDPFVFKAEADRGDFGPDMQTRRWHCPAAEVQVCDGIVAAMIEGDAHLDVQRLGVVVAAMNRSALKLVAVKPGARLKRPVGVRNLEISGPHVGLSVTKLILDNPILDATGEGSEGLKLSEEGDITTLSAPSAAWLKSVEPDRVVRSLASIELRPVGPDPRGGSSRERHQVFRRTGKFGVAGPELGAPTILSDHAAAELVKNSEWSRAQSGRRLLVLDDEGFGFTSARRHWEPWLGEPGAMPDLLLIKGSRHSPMPTTGALGPAAGAEPDQENLYTYLSSSPARAERTVVVLTADRLRTALGAGAASGLHLTKMVSWDLLIEQFQAAIMRTQGREFGYAKHVLVQFGLTGVLYFRREANGGFITLVFDPERSEGEYADRRVLGEVMGTTSVLTAAVADELFKWLKQSGGEPTDAGIAQAVVAGARSGLLSGRRYFDHGFGATADTVRRFELLELPIVPVFHSLRPRRDVLGDVTVSHAGPLTTTPGWSIVAHRITQAPPGGGGTPAIRPRAYQLACQIVVRGLENYWRRPDSDATLEVFPYVKFGKLLTIDRQEIEGLRSVRNAVTTYMRKSVASSRPLSIAVFGPPGSGKGFCVKQIVSEFGDADAPEFIQINVAQARTPSDVWRDLLRARDETLRGRFPVVFLDEFDVRDGDGRMSYLEKFLAPMQDGIVTYEGQPYRIGRCLLVFAGGTAHSYQDFDRSSSDGSPETIGERDAFTKQKGPDFVSRLSGHLNVAGPNRRHSRTGSAGPDVREAEEAQMFLRRSVLLRSLIEEQHSRLLDADRRASIDPNVLSALLTVDRYSHGARSMEAVLRMCVHADETYLSRSHFPMEHQLSMHVSPDFVELLARG